MYNGARRAVSSRALESSQAELHAGGSAEQRIGWLRDAIDFELQHLEKSATTAGATGWALVGALGVVGWALMAELERVSRFDLCLLAMVGCSLVVDGLRITQRLLATNAKATGLSRGFLVPAAVLIGRKRLAFAWDFARSLCFLFIVTAAHLQNSVAYVVVGGFYAGVCLIALLGMTLSSSAFPLPSTRSDEPAKPWEFGAPMLAFVGAVTVFLAVTHTGRADALSAARFGVLAAACLLIVSKLALLSGVDPRTEPLMELRRALMLHPARLPDLEVIARDLIFGRSGQEALATDAKRITARLDAIGRRFESAGQLCREYLSLPQDEILAGSARARALSLRALAAFDEAAAADRLVREERRFAAKLGMMSGLGVESGPARRAVTAARWRLRRVRRMSCELAAEVSSRIAATTAGNVQRLVDDPCRDSPEPFGQDGEKGTDPDS